MTINNYELSLTLSSISLYNILIACPFNTVSLIFLQGSVIVVIFFSLYVLSIHLYPHPLRRRLCSHLLLYTNTSSSTSGRHVICFLEIIINCLIRMGLFQSRLASRMSTNVTPRSASPIAESITDASFIIHLKDIKTIAQLYQSRVLKGVAPKKRRWDPNTDFLERVSLYQGDITTLAVDSIVNAANRSLLGGGGVDGAIHAAAGPKLLEECRLLNGSLTGESKITRGYDLPALQVIHTVGPVYSSDEKEERAKQLASAYRTSLAVAVENSMRHVAFPSISTGIYAYPVPAATRIALNEVRTFLESEQGNKLERVIFVVWSNQDKSVYESLIPEYFPSGEKADSEPELSESDSDTSNRPN